MPIKVSLHKEGDDIAALGRLATKFGFEQAVLVMRRTGDDGEERVVTWGKDKVHCEVAAKTGNFLKHEIMGWPQPGESE